MQMTRHSVSPSRRRAVIQQTQHWSAKNNMLLNTDKTTFVNFSLSNFKKNDG